MFISGMRCENLQLLAKVVSAICVAPELNTRVISGDRTSATTSWYDAALQFFL